MSQTGPGLTPGENKPNEVETNVVSDRQPAEADRSAEQMTMPEAQVNQQAQTLDQTQPVQQDTQQEQPMSNRAQERIQALDSAKRQAEAERDYFRQLAQSAFNVQPARPSQEELLAKQFATFDPSLGYPTDGKEFAQFVQAQAISKAQQTAQTLAIQNEENRQIAEFRSLYPTADDGFLGAVAGIRHAAQRSGVSLTYSQAARQYEDNLQKQYAQKVKADVASGETERAQSYVESTTSAPSTSRKGDTTPEFKNLGEMEAWLKANGAWDK